jgi:hypothetical protein
MRQLGMLACDYRNADVPTEAAFESFMARVPGHPPKGSEAWDEAAGNWYSSPEHRALNRWHPQLAWPWLWNPTPQPGIAMHKLYSNSMWVVTAVECEEALAAWERSCCGALMESARQSDSRQRDLIDGLWMKASAEGEDDLWGLGAMGRLFGQMENASFGHRGAVPPACTFDHWVAWLDYLECAAGHEGFEVH